MNESTLIIIILTVGLILQQLFSSKHLANSYPKETLDKVVEAAAKTPNPFDDIIANLLRDVVSSISFGGEVEIETTDLDGNTTTINLE